MPNLDPIASDEDGVAFSVRLECRRATVRFAKLVAGVVDTGDVLILAGVLGAGKTFFTRALCRALDVPRTERVTSPTYSLVNEYQGRIKVLHADLYRLNSSAEAEDLGIADQVGEALVVVEWGRSFAEALGAAPCTIDLGLAAVGRSARVSYADAEGALGRRIRVAIGLPLAT